MTSRIYQFCDRDTSIAESYTLRGLSSEEIEKWTQFCAAVFAYKLNPPPAAYFARHFWNDPERDASLVRVAVSSNNEIVASCRVFRRSISLGLRGRIIAAGGIGEVCTKEDHRRRGLSAELLKDALQQMDTAELYFLHSAPAFFPVYEKAGFRQSQTAFRMVTIDLRKMMDTSTNSNSTLPTRIRPALFPEDSKRLTQIHQSYSENRLLGCIIRSEEYWSQYLSQELDGTLWVTEEVSHSQITGWMSLRQRGEDRYQLREFGCQSIEDVPSVLLRLLQHIFNDHTTSQKQADRPLFISLHIPAFVFNEANLEDAEWVMKAVEEIDRGWMYKGESPSFDIPLLSKSGHHLVWPSDSF